MDRESFLEVLKTQYAEKIRAAYLESEHAGQGVDFIHFGERLTKLRSSAKVEGFGNTEFDELVRSEFPEAFDKIEQAKAPKLEVVVEATAEENGIEGNEETDSSNIKILPVRKTEAA